MPPFLMLILVMFAVVMVAFGKSPLDEWREEQRKYGKDPLVREINKANEKNQKNYATQPYKPPEGAKLYRDPNYLAIPRGGQYGSGVGGGTQGYNPFSNRPEAVPYGGVSPALPPAPSDSIYPPHMLKPADPEPTVINAAPPPQGAAPRSLPYP